MKRNTELETKFIRSLKDFSVEIVVENNAYKLVAQLNSKSILVTWAYPLMEVFFDFKENNKAINSDSIEIYDGESVSELHEYVTSIIINYFRHQTRIETLGRLLKRQELQIYSNGQWMSVFN